MNISLKIQCGIQTCSRRTGETCEYAGVGICMLFPSNYGTFTSLKQKEGLDLRCQACIDAEMNDPTIVLRNRIHDLEILNAGRGSETDG